MNSRSKHIAMACVIIILILLISLSAIFAYFRDDKDLNSDVYFEVYDWFGRLDGMPGDETWGTESNPYLINLPRHIKNLYVLQNSRNYDRINENTFFQISQSNGNPCAVGGDAYTALLDIPSIGSEDFPFISKLRGVKGSPYRLPGGEYTDTSALCNIRVTGYEGQIDIGLFGVVGELSDNTPVAEGDGTVGRITDLLLYNVQVETDVLGDLKENHSYYNLSENHETNHIGILAGHAQNAVIKNISVYYSGTQLTEPNMQTGADGTSDSHVAAISIAAHNTAMYSSSGGIIGYYKDIFVGDETPVSTKSYYDAKITGGGNTIGSGTGIMYSDNLWMVLDENTAGGLTDNAYPLQASFGTGTGELYEGIAAKNYFIKGVFTFAHSFQRSGNDSLVRLWIDENDSSLFSVADSYTENQITLSSSEIYKYRQVTNLNEPISNLLNDSRYLIVFSSGDDNYVLTRSGDSVVTQQLIINDDYITMPGGQLNFYSANVVPYTITASVWSDSNNYTGTASGTAGLYFYYGPYQADEANNGRRLRVYDMVSFAATSSSSYPESLAFSEGTGASAGLFRIKRARLGNYLVFDAANLAFTYTTTANNATFFKIFCIDTATPAYEYERVTSLNEAVSGGYRYMIVYNNGTTDYALTRNGTAVAATILTTKILPNPDSLYTYSAEVTPYNASATTWDDSNTTGAGGLYFRFGVATDARPLTISSSLTLPAATSVAVGNRIILVAGTGANAGSFLLRHANASGTTYYLRYNNGFTGVNSTTNAAYVKIYRIKINAPQSDTFACTPVSSIESEAVRTSARYMLVYESGGNSYALVRNGTSFNTVQLTAGQVAQINEGVITLGDVLSYSARVVPGAAATTNTTEWSTTNTSSTGLSFFYGSDNYALTIGASLSFSTSTGTGYRVCLTDGGNGTFRLNRTSGTYYIGFNTGGGGAFTSVNSANSGVYLKIYRLSAIFEPTSRIDDKRTVYTASDFNKITYEMSENVLVYTGNGSDTDYHYEITDLTTLGWGDENLDIITKINTALIMADAANYHYYTTGTPYGLTDVMLAEGVSTSPVPQGSVAFQVQGAGTPGAVSLINIIVATNPRLQVNQTIACCYFGTTGSGGTNNRRTQVASFPLPRFPEQGSTTPIYVREPGGSYREAYPNFNTVLVAYTFQIDCSYSKETTRTYFLESTVGAASFVYFSAERTAAEKSRNPQHENELFFNAIEGIDYVYSKTIDNQEFIIDVKHLTDYYRSLIMPYFGYAPNTATEIIDDFIIVSNYNMQLIIRRRWLAIGFYSEKGYGELYITANGLNAGHVNFVECVRLIKVSGINTLVFADHVILTKTNTNEIVLARNQ